MIGMWMKMEYFAAKTPLDMSWRQENRRADLDLVEDIHMTIPL